MRRKLAGVVGVVFALILGRPAAAADFSCAQWLEYRMGNNSLQAQGLVLITFAQGLIDGINAFADQFNGYLIKEVSPGKFVPAPPTRPLTLENTVAVLDRICTQSRDQNAHAAVVNEVFTRMAERATPIMESMRVILHNLNDAKGYK